jgi:ribosomal protein S18 acetylase RimI-like enzyme
MNKPEKKSAALLIRKATTEDALAVGLLRSALDDELALLRPEDCRAFQQGGGVLLDILIASDIFVAVEFNEIIGYVCMAERETAGLLPYRRRRYAAVDSIYVDLGCRGRGVGSALMREAKRWGESRGLDYLEMTVFSDNQDAVYLCRHESFAEVRQTLRYVYE